MFCRVGDVWPQGKKSVCYRKSIDAFTDVSIEDQSAHVNETSPSRSLDNLRVPVPCFPDSYHSLGNIMDTHSPEPRPQMMCARQGHSLLPVQYPQASAALAPKPRNSRGDWTWSGEPEVRNPYLEDIYGPMLLLKPTEPNDSIYIVHWTVRVIVSGPRNWLGLP